MKCDECKKNTPRWYSLCHMDEIKNKLKNKGLNNYCIIDIIDTEIKKKIKEELDNMVTFDYFEK